MKDNIEHDFISKLIDPDTLYHSAPCGYLSMLPDGTIIKINNTLLGWLGFSAGDVINRKRLTDLLSNGGKLYYQVFYLPLLQLQDKVNEINFDIYRKDGSFFPALLNANLLRDAAGNALAVNVVLTDITDRKKYETELLNARYLAESEKNKFETVAAYIPEMIWTANPDGRITYINKRFVDNFNIVESATDWIYEFVHPDDYLSARRAWAEAIRRGTGFSLQLRLKNKDGEFEWYEIKATPYHGQDGRVVKWLGSCLNVHAHILELERRDDFISVASHELKTPITSLNLTLQLLGTGKAGLTDKQTKLIEQASRNAKKIHTLIDDLLNVKRLTVGQLALRIQKVNVKSMITNCVNPFLTTGKYDITVDADPLLVVNADEHRIEQVVVNFINNAIKYASGSPISVRAERSGEKIKVSVIDQGPGISGDKIPRLFERYYRADHSGKEYSGLGLGLYICAEIIQRHGGDIGVESQPGSGSTFWFRI